MAATRRNLLLLLLHARETGLAHFRPILNHFGLTDQQWRVLRTIADAPAPLEPGQIADACHLLGPSLTGILSRLDEIGLVRRARSSTDQRRRSISLTERGEDLVARMRPLIERQYDLIETEIGADRFGELYEVLDRLVSRLQAGIPSALDEDGSAEGGKRLTKSA